jgi:hypothetical protein
MLRNDFVMLLLLLLMMMMVMMMMMIDDAVAADDDEGESVNDCGGYGGKIIATDVSIH